MKSLSLIVNSNCKARLPLYILRSAKRFLLLFAILLLNIACQQQIPEVAYDLDAQSITEQTRNSEVERLILFQDRIGFVNEGPIKTYTGFVIEMNFTTENTVSLQLTNEAKEELSIELGAHLKKYIHKNMKLIVRYTIVEDSLHLMEVRKEA